MSHSVQFQLLKRKNFVLFLQIDSEAAPGQCQLAMAFLWSELSPNEAGYLLEQCWFIRVHPSMFSNS